MTPAMTPAEAVAAMYAARDDNFLTALDRHLMHGYVMSSPHWFVFARPVQLASGPDSWLDWDHVHASPDAWLITAFAGDLASAVRLFPHALQWVVWQRFGRGHGWRRYKFESLLAKARTGV